MSDGKYKVLIRDYVIDCLYEVVMRGRKIVNITLFEGPHDLRGRELEFSELPKEVVIKLIEEVGERRR